MIYFLDNDLQLQKIVTSKNIYETNHEHELNGYIIADALLPLDYVKKFIDKVEYFGYYYRGTFYLHKIQSTEDLHQDDVCLISGRHIFFDDMLYGKLIEDVRPQNRNALDILNSTIAANSRWRPQLVDTTGTLSTNFYWQPMFDVIEFVNKEFRLDFLPKVLFDGQKINGFDIEFAEKIGNDTAIRIPFGYRTLELTHEIDYSEIVTKLVVHGKGEEVGDGYGRRINIADVEFSRNGVKSPKGSLYLEDESLTATYGNDGQTPREGREVFEDIESPSELAEAGYNLYQELSRPRMAFEAKVADIGDVGIGDSVMIIRREHDLYFKARIHKVKVDLLNPDDAEVELGDYEFFKETKAERRSRKDDEAYKRRNTSMIEQLKRQFDKDFNDRVNQFREEFNQAKIDIFAEIEADRENMQNLLDTKSDEWTENFNQSVAESKEYAEQQAQEKASAVKTELENVTDGHQSMLLQLESNVMNIDDYLGDAREIPLDQRFLDMTQNFEERISSVREGNYNMVRGTSLDESSIIYLNGMDLVTTESINYVSAWSNSGFPYLRFLENITIEARKQYTLSFDYRTDKVPEMDVVRIRRIDGTLFNIRDIENYDEANIYELVMDNTWHRAYIRFTPTENITGQLDIGTDYVAGNTTRGSLHIRLPYLTTTGRTQWMFHPLDTTQNVEEVSRRLTQLEDGYKEMIVRSEWNAELNSINQTIRDYQTTVDGVEDTIIQLQDSEVITRGREVLDTVDGFQRKVWMGDFDRPNLIPHTTFNNRENRDNWGAWGRYGSTYGGVFEDYAIVGDSNSSNSLGIISPDVGEYIEAGKQYTLTWEASVHYPQTTSTGFRYMYLMNIGESNISHQLPNPTYEQIGTGTNAVYRKYKLTFTSPVGINPNTQILFGTNTVESNINAFFRFRHPKLEEGAVASPFKTSFSMLEQRADEISLAVQGIDLNGMLTQSDIRIDPGYVQLGSQRLGDNQLASIFRVSPNSIDAITERMVLNGDLYVDGDITALAVKAIEGNFARLFANQLTANVITSDHIQVGTGLVNKIFATSARIDELITKNHFVNNVKAMSIEAVEGQFSSLMTKYFSANYIDVNYINGKNAWFETQYVKTSNISNLTSQTAFIRDIQTIEITANQLNINTLHSKLKGVEGGLTIYGPDGRVLINNSILKASFDVQVYDFYAGSLASFNGSNFHTTSSFWQAIKYFYTDFKGSQLLVSWAIGLQTGNSASEYAEVQVRGFGSNNPIGTRSTRQFVKAGETTFHNQIINLGVPDYSTIQGYLEIRRSPGGSNMDNRILARVLRISLIN